MPNFDLAVEAIQQQGFFVGEGFWPEAEALAMAVACQDLANAEKFRPARVGRAEAQRREESLRSDLIHWLEGDQPPALAAYLEALETYRKSVNRQLFLGLHDVEVHAAMYPPGAHYGRHLDRFQDDDARTLTAILYLNPDWQKSDGGLLRIELPDGSTREVLPSLGTFVSFISADFPHEVLPTQRPRLTLTGWYRRQLGLF